MTNILNNSLLMDSFEFSVKPIMSLKKKALCFLQITLFLISHCVARYGTKLANECNINVKHFFLLLKRYITFTKSILVPNYLSTPHQVQSPFLL